MSRGGENQPGLTITDEAVGPYTTIRLSLGEPTLGVQGQMDNLSQPFYGYVDMATAGRYRFKLPVEKGDAACHLCQSIFVSWLQAASSLYPDTSQGVRGIMVQQHQIDGCLHLAGIITAV